MGTQERKREIYEAVRREAWSLSGPSRVVKVVPCDVGQPRVPLGNVGLKGFVCQEKVLLGTTPGEIEKLLGLRVGSCARGCRVYRFKRLPNVSEVEYELTTQYPDGLAYGPMSSPHYPPGSPVVHQWRLLVDVPVEDLAIDLAPRDRYPYLYGRS